MKVDIYFFKNIYSINEKLEYENIGFIETDTFDENYFWHICNWSAFTDKKPEILHSKIAACSVETVFYNPEKELYYIPLGFGWKTVNDFEKVIEHFKMGQKNNCLYLH